MLHCHLNWDEFHQPCAGNPYQEPNIESSICLGGPKPVSGDHSAGKEQGKSVIGNQHNENEQFLEKDICKPSSFEVPQAVCVTHRAS